MNVVTLTYDLSAKSWSVPIPTQLDSERTLVLVFGPAELLDSKESPIAEIVGAFPRSQVIGCSSGGAVSGSSLRDGVVTVTVTQFEKTTMSSAIAQHAEAFTVGQSIGKKLSKPSLRAVLVFGDGVEVSGAELVRGLNSTLDQSMVVVGGMAGDGGTFRRSWVLGGGSIRSGIAAAVGLYGEHIVVGHASRSGWTKLGDELTVTKSDGRVIYELDGRPALAVYEERIALAGSGQLPLPLMIPLGVRASARHEKSLVRTVLGVEPSKQALTLAVDVPQGYLVQPLKASPASLLEAARDAAASLPTSATPTGTNALVLTVSHASRRLVLGKDDVSSEITTATAALTGPSPHVTGFYGFGEIAPSAQGHSDLNNQSFTIATFMESPTPIARRGSRGLATGAARAQAPTTAAGPAAHLRSRHQTVDDLFAAIELEGERRPNAGGKPTPGAPVPPPIRRATTGGMRAPPLPPKRDSASAVPAQASAARASGPQQIVTPSTGVAAAAAAAATAMPKVAAPSNQTAPISGTRQPVTVTTEEDFEEEKTISGSRYPMAISSFGYEGGLGRWTVDPLPSAPDSPQTLVLAFGGGPNHVGAVEALMNAYPQSHILGCGAPTLRRAGATATLTVNTVRFTHTKIGTAWTELSMGAAEAGQALGQKLVRPDLRAVFLVGDGHGLDKEAFLRALVGVCPSNVTISGGFTSGDRGAFVLCNALHRTGIAAAVGFYGDHLLVANSVQAGFEAFGPERVVTKASGSVVYELDGRPALAVYSEYLRGPISANTALTFPLGVKRGDVFAPRLPISFDPSAQSLTFAGEVPVDAIVRLMRGNHDRLLADVDAATRAAALGAGTGNGLVIAVSSSGRSDALGDRAEEEVEGILDSLPSNVAPHVTGFYSLAEIGANAKTGRADLANDSISLTVFTESPLPVGERTEHVVQTTRQTMPAPPLANPAVTPSPAQVTRRSIPTNRAASLPPPVSSRPRSVPDSAVPSFVNRRRDVVRPSMSSAGGGSSNAKVNRRQHGDITIFTFTGRLSESFKGDAQGRELSGTVVFDLGGVERITSFGVREWLQMLNVSNDRVKKLYFAHCSEAVVNQLSMIRKFAGNAQVVSFFAPYLCDSCGEQFERLFDCEYDAEAIRAGDVPESICQQCSGRGRFDDDPETYFAFTPQHVGQTIPQGVRDVLNELDAMTPQGSGEATEKVIEGDLTRVRVKAKAGAGLRWQRILDGIEGTVVIDLGGVGTLDNPGLANFEQALSSLGTEVESVRLDRAPQVVVERFAVQGLPRRVVVASAVLTAFCPACNVQRPALVVVEEHAHAFASGRGPTLSCKRCNGALTLVDAGNITSFLARQRRRPSMQPRANSTPPPPQVAQIAAPSPVQTLPSMSAFPGPGQLPVMETMQAEPSAGSGRGIIIGAVILAVAILGSAAVFARARKSTTDETIAEPKPAASVPKLADIPPGWVERTFVEEGGMLLVVGRCERAPTGEQALIQARNDAINRLVQQLYTDLTASSSDEYLAVQSKIELTGPRSSQIAEKYLRQTSAFALPERGETIVRQKDGGVEAFARYRLSRAVYTQIRSLYSTTASFQGATIARIFPLLDVGKEDGELVVTSISKTSRLADSLHVGDFLLRFNGKSVASVESLNKAMEEWNQSPQGVTFELQVRSNGNVDTVKIKKQAPVAAPVFRPALTPTPAPAPAPRPAPKDLGIIPPSRTF